MCAHQRAASGRSLSERSTLGQGAPEAATVSGSPPPPPVAYACCRVFKRESHWVSIALIVNARRIKCSTCAHCAAEAAPTRSLHALQLFYMQHLADQPLTLSKLDRITDYAIGQAVVQKLSPFIVETTVGTVGPVMQQQQQHLCLLCY